ncbi:hypothetical protein NMY22_g10500 [Coprinellus aureogranulatus]|nr:hypothetical protein NMY22_g10500 [Coprinellus aureogranulatus]
MKQAYSINAINKMPSPPSHCVFLDVTSSVVKIALDIGHPGLLSTISSFYEALSHSRRKPLSITISRTQGSPQNTVALEAVAVQSIMNLLGVEWGRVKHLAVHTHLRSSLSPVLELLELRCQHNLENLSLTSDVGYPHEGN